MKDPFFFGYGSLVNRDTHDYPNAYRARLKGWRRTWRHTKGRSVPFLTSTPCADSEIDGLVAMVPGGDWAALDLREAGYDRHHVGDALTVQAEHPVQAQIYAVPHHHAINPVEKPAILMSYLDVVVQGYLREFGEEGAHAFFATTDGWDTPVRDDRHAPRYSRHRVLNAAERAFVDDSLSALSVRVIRE
jgi:hypothetical protein